MQSFKKNAAYLTATVLGIGYAPKAPGTFGTLPGILLYVLWPSTLFTAILFAAGWIATLIVLQHIEDRDPSFIVIDEVVGMMVTLCLLPELTLTTGILAFALFRLFDIVKPWPIHKVEALCKMGSKPLAAFVVMIDDIIAALMAGCVLRVVLWFL